MSSPVLKVAVSAKGDVTLEGLPISVSELELAFQTARERQSSVWYYREGAAGEPSDAAASILKLIVHYKLPISLSTKPDFSDFVDLEGRSRPREMPASAGAVAEPRDVEAVFADARRRASERRADGAGQLAIVRADRRCLVMTAPPAGSVPPQMTKLVEAIVPASTPRRIVVIADTVFADAASPTLAEASRAIPFFGLVIGLSCVGHAVVMFEGRASAIDAGCRNADVLIVDSGVVPRLEKGWEHVGTMRNPNILVIDRASQKLLMIRSAGATKGKLEFPAGSVIG